jgi:hypothetical protein
MGPQGVEIFDNMSNLSEENKTNPDSVWEAFRTYFEPKSNYRLARFQLRDMRQLPNEPIDSFMTRLRSQAQKCKFSSTAETEDNLIDQIIKGVAHDSIRKKLLDQEPDKLTLDNCIKYARTIEATNAHFQSLQAVGVSEISRNRKPTQKHVVKSQTKKPETKLKLQNKPTNCYFCGGKKHNRDQCPAKNQKCNKCQKMGHWEKFVILTRKNKIFIMLK